MAKHKRPTTIDPLRRALTRSKSKPVEHKGIVQGPYPSTYVRADGGLVRKRTIYLADTLARRLAAFCAERSVSVSHFIETTIESVIASAEGSRTATGRR